MAVPERLRVQQGPLPGRYGHPGQLLGCAGRLVQVAVGGERVRADVWPQQPRGALISIPDGVLRLFPGRLWAPSVFARRVGIGNERGRAQSGRDGGIGRGYMKLERAATNV